jgi:hypothetical protein
VTRLLLLLLLLHVPLLRQQDLGTCQHRRRCCRHQMP